MRFQGKVITRGTKFVDQRGRTLTYWGTTISCINYKQLTVYAFFHNMEYLEYTMSEIKEKLNLKENDNTGDTYYVEVYH